MNEAELREALKVAVDRWIDDVAKNHVRLEDMRESFVIHVSWEGEEDDETPLYGAVTEQTLRVDLV